MHLGTPGMVNHLVHIVWFHGVMSVFVCAYEEHYKWNG